MVMGSGINPGTSTDQAPHTSTAEAAAPPRSPSPLDEDEIVISGISGRFPESAHMNEFMENLLNNVNMVTVNERRFKPGLYGIPSGFGTLKEIDRFDADAFGMLPNQVRKTDPQLRMTLETVYEAMCDGGVNPADERGSRTGVFLGLCMTESLTLLSAEPNRIDGLALIGCSTSMFANRVSYAFDFKGPSCAYDTACSTSAFALEAAVSAMREGRCDAAIVTASTLILTPTGGVQFDRLGMLSRDSACKSFDASGDGFARAEAVATIYLQRASVAKRAYASVLHIKTNTDGYKDNGITYPSAAMQEELLRSVYREAKARGHKTARDEVTYVEAHGTGTVAGDPQELAAISRTFCKGRQAQAPLLVGSVKSNMGHAEGASGLCSIAKIVVMLQTGLIPANLHYSQPAYGLNSVRSGAVKIVHENTEWNGGLIAVNSFGFGGVNVHFVLKPYVTQNVSKGSELARPSPSAKLVLFSGRDEAGVSKALQKIIEADSPNLVLLANELCKNPNPVATVRGFAVDPDILQVEPRSTHAPPLWLVFNGIGSQWLGMGRDLLQLPAFANSIEISTKVLKDRFNFDLYKLLNNEDPDPSTYENAVNCFVGITACQIALVDVLLSLGIRPTGFVGHSAGEMVCAYVDECLSAEETIVCAYLRGESLTKSSTHAEPGAMAVVSLSLPQVEKLCPPGSGLYPACHNGLDSITVSGTRPLIHDLVQLLKDKKKGVTEVKSCGIAFHSPYIAKASAKFLAALRAEFKDTSLARSSSWISTSIPGTEWNTPLNATASPEYFVNNFLSPVLFYEALQHVPENAVVLEVGPSGLLRGLIKKACPSCTVIPLQSRDSKDGLLDLYTALGKLYLAGVNFDANKLFLSVLELDQNARPFPVPLGTPFLSPLVAGAWNHSTSWEVPYFGMNGELQLTRFEIDMSSEADAFLPGHVVQGRILFPATGYLLLVWKHFAQTRQLQFQACPVVFENVRFNRVTVLGRKDKVEFRIHISEISGAFEVKEGGAIVASGTVRAPVSNPALLETQIDESEFVTIEKEQMEMGKLCQDQDTGEVDPIRRLDSNELYKRFRFYGFEYTGAFRGIRRCDPDFQYFVMDWRENWIAFLDTFLQTCINPFEPCLKVRLPTAIGKIVLDPSRFLEYVANNADADKANTAVPIFVYKDTALGLVKCHGVEMSGLKLTAVNRKVKEVPPELFSYHFTPYFDNPAEVDAYPDEITVTSPVLQCVCIVMENLTNRFMDSSFKMTVIEATHTEPDLQESVAVDNLVRMSYGVLDMTYTIFAQHETELPEGQHAPPPPPNIDLRHFDEFHTEGWLDRTYDIIILHNHAFLAAIACEYLKKGKFLILKLRRSDEITKEELLAKMGPKLGIVAVKYSKTHVVYLIRKTTKPSVEPCVVIPVSSRCMFWVDSLRDAIRDQEERAIARIKATVTEKAISKTKANTSTRTPKPPRIYLVSNGPEEHDSGIQGLINCLRKEKYSQHCRMIFSKSGTLDLDFSNPNPELQQVLTNDLVVNMFDEDGRWGFYSSCTKLNRSNKSAAITRKVEHAFIGMETIGDLTSFRWIEGFDLKKLTAIPSTRAETEKFTPIDVHFAALNFKDIMLATGSLPSPDPTGATPFTIESPLGLEFSGLTTGDDGLRRRVCGFNEGQSIATQVLGCQAQLWEIPPAWSLAQAATVPVVYATAYLALVERGRIQNGESVLIHSGAGGVGQAAIRIALAHKCTVFTTAGSPDKKEFLRKTFPDILEPHIGNSRDTSFERRVLRQTSGRGVDVILNSLSGEKLDASVRCLAKHGRFLEIGKFDLVANKTLGMELFLKDASFHGVMLDSLSNMAQMRRLKGLVQEGIDSGVVQPLPSRVFQLEQVEPAFRYMGTGKHIGKILIQVRKNEDEHYERFPRRRVQLEAYPRVYFDPATSYIVVGGLGGIGLEFINWMIGRNARQFVISSRSGVKTAYQSEYIRAWRQRGVILEIVPFNASRMEDAEALLDHATKFGPVDGFFNLAMRLEMSFMRDQTEEQFWAAMNPKVVLTRNMDQLTRVQCPEMSHFVVISSVVAGIGMPGQCNYGMGNSGAEQICERRHRDELAGKAIQLGPISEAGFFQEMCQNHLHKAEQLKSYGGSGVQTISSLLKCLDVLLISPDPIVVSRVNRELEYGSKAGSSVCDTFADRLSHVLGTDISKLNPKTKLTELGLDSIVAMEVRQVLEQDFGLNLSATEVRTITLEQILEMSKNSEKNVMTPSKMSARRRAATADLFQFNFMRNAKKAKILYKQCVHPLNKITDKSQGTIFLCNSVEGPHILRILGGLMKRPAYTMQFPENAPLDSLDAFVGYYLEQLKATEPHGPYVLAGYSAGALVAIELALRLQAAGDEVLKVVLIDMSPGRAEAILEENLGADRTHIEEMDVLIVVLSQILNIDRAQVELIMASLPDRESRLEKAVELGSALFDEDVDFKMLDRLLGENQMKIINFFNRYKPSSMYNGKIALVRTTQNLISYDSTEYWGLEEFCTQIPVVHTIESTHSYLIAEPGVYQLASIIND